MSDELVKLPIGTMNDALYVVAASGDAATSVLLRGWDAMCREVAVQVYGDPNEEQVREWAERLADPEEWQGDAAHWHEGFEDGRIDVTRVTEDRTIAALQPRPIETAPRLPGGIAPGEMRCAVCGAIFEANKGYSMVCQHPMCPIFPNATCQVSP